MQLLFILLFSFILTFTSNNIAAKNDLVSCQDASVMLSKVIVPCDTSNLKPTQNFGIPQMRLDFNALEMIFIGSESSGGYSSGRMGRMNIPSITPFKVLFNCTAKLISDGGKLVSYLSQQRFNLTGHQHSHVLKLEHWAHYLIEGNNFDQLRKVKVSAAPNILINNYTVNLSYNKNTTTERLTIFACEMTEDDNQLLKIDYCGYDENNLRAVNYQAELKTFSTDHRNYTIIKNLRVTCLRKI